MIIPRNRQLSAAGSTNHNAPRQLLEPSIAEPLPTPSPEPPPEHQSTVAVNGGQRRSTTAVNGGQPWRTTVDHCRTTVGPSVNGG
ncbi:hypothetical protein Tco_1511400 [Tanacetum coccineum]